MCLFDGGQRTYGGPADVGESFYAYINRSARHRAVQARVLCEQWFAHYAKSASTDELKRFVGDFRSKNYKQHYAAWFELLTYQILVSLGCSVKIHPNLPGSDKHPDFGASAGGSRFLVEATVVAPDKDPFALSDYEQDAQKKFIQLEIPNFKMRIAQVYGTLNRRLKNREIRREFGKLVAEYDPDEVRLRIDRLGNVAVPSKTIHFGDWHIVVRLWPLPLNERAPRKARVAPWPQGGVHDASVPQVRDKITALSAPDGPSPPARWRA